MDRYEDLYLNHKYMGGEWSEEVDWFLHYSSRYMRDNIYYFQNYEENNDYEMSLLNAINELRYMRKDDQERIFDQFFELDSMEVLVETNPELLSRAVLALLSNGKFNTNVIRMIIDIFLKSCINRLENIDIIFLGFDTIINAITIARKIQSKWFLDGIIKALRYQLFGGHARFFVKIIYLYPKFVADLINIMPEIFIEMPLEFFESLFLEKEFHHAKYGEMIDYIRVFRCLYQLYYKKGYDEKEIYKKLRMIIHIISEFRETNFLNLTINQIDDLLWYIDFVGDKHISKEIKEVLQQHLKHHKYRDTPFFNKTFNYIEMLLD